MQNRFRIIGGEWRSRRFTFPGLPGLRPSPDRVRETLFNWLAPVIPGARCADLFAGSGALGLEALSRGAGEVVFVDHERAALDAIDEHLERLRCDRGTTTCSTAERWISGATGPFDVVFLDPPFGAGLVAPVLQALAASGCVRPGGYVYVEMESETGPPDMPDGWKAHRTGTAGRVGYHLLVVSR
jgi:16S rRNA (guanine966-N2)-methyltransferase